MVEQGTITFVSILFLVVITLSYGLRHDLSSKPMQYSGTLWGLPNLGRFTLIHALNVMILYIGYFVVITDLLNGVDDIGSALLLMVVVIFIALPFIELRSYEELFKDGSVPSSYRRHLIFALLTMVVVPTITFLLIATLHPVLARIIFLVVYGFILIAGIHSFLDRLSSELKPEPIN